MQLLVISATLALLAVVGLAQPTNVLQDLQLVAKMPREQRVAALQTILQKIHVRNDVDEAIMALMEQLRTMMPEGVPSLGIPPLEPYFLEHYTVDLSGTGLPAIKLVMDKTTVKGLSSFIINKIANDLTHLKADYDFSIPSLAVNGQYNISGEVLGLELFGNGPFTVDLGKLTAWGTVKVGSEGNSLDGKVFMDSISVDFKLDSMKVNFENLMGGGSMGEMLNQLISEEGPAMMEQYKPEVEKLISGAVLSIANPILGQFTLREILDYLGIPHSQ